MTNFQAYQNKLAEITAIPDDAIITHRNVPVETFIQDAENLHKWCQQDREMLTASGLDWSLVEEIQEAAGALREAQSQWTSLLNRKEETWEKWKEKTGRAFGLYSDLLAAFKYAFSENELVLNRIKEIREKRNTHAAKIQGLNDLAVLGRSHREELQLISFDLTLLDKAAQLADEVADLLATRRAEKYYNAVKKIRDQAYTYLKGLVSKVYAAGKYVFRHNKKRRAGYAGSYYSKNRRKPATGSKQAGNEGVAA